MTKIILGMVVMGGVLLPGCLNVNVPEEPVRVYTSQSSPKVDSRRVPKTTTLSNCQTELNNAYVYIQSLERRNQKLENDKAELKAKVKSLEKRLDRYED